MAGGRCVVMVGLAAGLIGACHGGSRESGTRAGPGDAGTSVATRAATRVRPLVTDHTVTLAVGAEPGWAELDAGCYFDAMRMLGRDPLDPLESALPGLRGALQANHFDLEIDLLGVGLMKCGESMCAYAGVRLDDLDQGRALAHAILGLPGLEGEDLGPDHVRLWAPTDREYVFDVRLLAIDWEGIALPDDYRAYGYGRATHLVLVEVGEASRQLVAPAMLLATSDEARERVEDIERLVPDARGRCAIAEMGEAKHLDRRFDLHRIRAIAVTPPRTAPDALAAALGRRLSLSIEVDLELSPTPTRADVDRFVEVMARARAEKVSEAPGVRGALQAVFAVVESGRHVEIGDRRLRLSWRSADVPADLATAMTGELDRIRSRRPVTNR